MKIILQIVFLKENKEKKQEKWKDQQICGIFFFLVLISEGDFLGKRMLFVLWAVYD